MLCKKMIVSGFALLCMSTMLVAQQGSQNRELSVEESYLQESMETMIIREQSRAESRDMKLVALDFIKDSIDAGRANEETVETLEYLGLEGTVYTARDGGLGRIINNFPDVRAKAAQYLGEIGGEVAKDALVKIMLAEPEPMVLTEAVKALGKIGLNDNEEVVTTISWIVTRFDVLNPDNALALAALDAYEKIAIANGGIKDASTIRTIMRIAEGPYIRPVQEKAKAVLIKMRSVSSNNSSNGR